MGAGPAVKTPKLLGHFQVLRAELGRSNRCSLPLRSAYLLEEAGGVDSANGSSQQGGFRIHLLLPGTQVAQSGIDADDADEPVLFAVGDNEAAVGFRASDDLGVIAVEYYSVELDAGVELV